MRNSGFPAEYLPKVVEPGTTVGHLAQAWHHVPKGAVVLTGMGDLQCSTLAVMPGAHDAGVCVVCASVCCCCVYVCPVCPAV